MRKRLLALVLGFLIALVAMIGPLRMPQVAAQQPTGVQRIVSFQDGRLPNPEYSGTTDALLVQTRSSQPGGQLRTCGVDGNDPTGTGMDQATVLRWDLTSLPRTARISGAFIILNVEDRSDHVYHLYPLQRAWVEDQATWMQYRRDRDWSEPGAHGVGDRSPIKIGSLRAPENGPAVIMLNGDGIATLQRWVAEPSTNFGLIIDDAAPGDGIDFSCSEALVAAERPILTVSFR